MSTLQDMFTMGGPTPFSQQELDSSFDFDPTLYSDLLAGDEMSNLTTDATAARIEFTNDVTQMFPLPGPQMPQEVQPMQFQMNQQTPMPSFQPQQPPGPMIPLLTAGPSYSPMLGMWFYPAVPNPTSMLRNTDDSYGRGRSTSRANTPHGEKRMQGYTNSSESSKRPRLAAAATPLPIGHRSKPPSFVRACVCAARQAKIPRPQNAFILYRSHYSKQLMRSDEGDPTLSKTGNQNNQKVSALAAQKWRNESEQVKAHFRRLAEEEKVRHAQTYPEYKYNPHSNKAAKFGTPECTCGAYVANVAALNGNMVSNLNGILRADDSEPDLDEYVPPRTVSTSTQQHQAPVAALMPMAPMPDFGFATPAQNAQAAIAWQQAQRSAATVEHDEEQTLRRSTRSTRKSVSYVEPEESDFETTLRNALESDAIEPTHLPAAIDTSGKPAPSPLVLPQAAAQPAQSPPARNTRSKSRSMSPEFVFPEMPEETDIDFDTLFGDGRGQDGFPDSEATSQGMSGKSGRGRKASARLRR